MAAIDDKNQEPTRAIPEPTLRRLPIYYQYLKRMQAEKGSEYISSTQIGSDLNILPIQVRKDLQMTEAAGKPKLGYDVAELIRDHRGLPRLEQHDRRLSRGRRQPRFGPPGLPGIQGYGLNIIAAFDADERR